MEGPTVKLESDYQLLVGTFDLAEGQLHSQSSPIMTPSSHPTLATITNLLSLSLYICVRYIPSPALVFSTLLLPQTSWFANNVVSSGTRTAAHGVHRRLLSMQRIQRSIFQSDYTAPCSSSLKPSWQFTNIFITFFFYKAKELISSQVPRIS